MKRVLIAIVTIALLLTACGAKAPAQTTPTDTTLTETAPAETTPNYLGTWKIDYLLVGNSKIAQSELVLIDEDIASMQFILKDGGTAYVAMGSQSGFVSWSETASGIQLDNQMLVFENGYLTLTVDEGKTIFFQKVSDSQLIENVDNSPADVPESSAVETVPTTEEAPTETTENLVDGMRPEFKEAMDAYEDFYNEYCEFLAKYAKNPTDFSLLGKYAGMLSKAADMDKAFEAWDQDDLNSAELQYYLALSSQVLQKLAGVMK